MRWGLFLPIGRLTAILRCLPLVLAMSVCAASIAKAQGKNSPQAQTSPAQAQTKQAGQPAATATAAKAPDLSKEAIVFDRLYTRIREEADGTGTRETTARIRILAEPGVKQMAVLAFTYTASNQQIDVGYVRVIKPDGTVVVTPAYNIQDLPADVTREAPMYSDIHQKHVAVKGLGVGDTLEYDLTLRTLKPDVAGQFWLEYTFEKDLVILDEELDLDVPADKAVTVASTDVQPTINTTDGRKLYHWTSSNLARPDPDAPPKSKKHWKLSVQVTTFTGWQQVGEWYAALEKDALAVTPAIQAHADSLTKGLTTDEEKVRAILNDVALHIHYVGLDFGIGRYQPHAADDVLSNEYGDCKDKHTLLATLLKAEGIESWPVLISTNRPLDPDIPSPAQFDHVITQVSVGGKPVWMDSTAEVAPMGVLFATLRDKQALAIPSDKPAYLERTPADLPFAQLTKVEVTGKLSNEGEFTAHFTESFIGDGGMLIRTAFRSVPQSQWKPVLQVMANATGFAGEVSNPDVSAIEQVNQPIRLSFDYTREKYGEWDNKQISPPMPPVGIELAPGVKSTKPADDIDLGSPGEVDLTSSVQLPAGWKLNPPPGTDVSEDWAEYHSKYGFTDGKFTAERRLVVKKDKVPLDQWDKYLAFRRAIFNDATRMMTLQDPAFQRQMQSAVEASFAPGWFGRGAQAQFSAENREKVDAAFDNLRTASRILESSSPISAEDLATALKSARSAVDDLEADSLELSPDDPHSLYWAELLGYGWSTLGWAAFESKDLDTAQNYLPMAWRLCHDRLSGYQLGRLLEARNSKVAALHQFELAHVTTASNPLSGLLLSDYRVDDLIATSYKEAAGRKLTATSLNHGAYNGSLAAELDKDLQVKQFVRTTKLTGSGIYAVVFESGKPVKVNMLQGDKGFEAMTPLIQARTFPTQLPKGSKAKLLREARVVCSPWAGCDLYLVLPTSIELPSRPVLVHRLSKSDSKSVQIEVSQ
jgi:transglutaminase-like putative cysteine protease